MNTVLHLNRPPPYGRLHPPWPRRRPTLLPSPLRHSRCPSPAGARGFGTPISTSEKRTKTEEEDTSDGKSGTKGGDEDDDIPQVVFDRMLARILVSVGTPMATGVAVTYLLGMLQERGVWDVPQWLPLLTILLSFGTSGLGIAYGTLSASWDPEKKGSLLGWEEAKQNWPELWKEQERRR